MPSISSRLMLFLNKTLFWGGSLFAVAMFNYFALATSRIIWVATFFTFLILGAMITLYLKILRNHPHLAGGVGALLIISLSSVIWASPTLAQPSNFGDTGGVDLGSPTQGLGCSSANVWHLGRYPMGGFTNYHAGIRVRYCTGHEFYNRMDSKFSVTPYIDSEQFVDYNASDFAVTKRLYTCLVQGKLRWHGCIYAYAKFKLSVAMPLKGEFKTVYPWVKIWINANGGVFKWDWSGGLM